MSEYWHCSVCCFWCCVIVDKIKSATVEIVLVLINADGVQSVFWSAVCCKSCFGVSTSTSVSSWQVELHQSLARIFQSSHHSLYSRSPFQQIPWFSIRHIGVHQSPFHLFQSSHSSPASCKALPQIARGELPHQLFWSLVHQAVATYSPIFLLAEKLSELVTIWVPAVFHCTGLIW